MTDNPGEEGDYGFTPPSADGDNPGEEGGYGVIRPSARGSDVETVMPNAELDLTYTVEINYRQKAKFFSIDVRADSREEALGIGKWAAEELREEIAPGDEMDPTLSITNVTVDLKNG